MKKQIWIHKAGSFGEAEKYDADYYADLSNKERIEMVQALREAYFKSKGMFTGEGGKRLRRVFRIVKQP